MKKKLLEEAQRLLLSNPADVAAEVPKGFSESWFWAVQALGWAYYDWEKALICFERAMSAQSSDGGIALHLKDFPEPEGIALQERPYYAPILWRLYENAPGSVARKAAMSKFLPMVLAHQYYWYNHRDPRQEGLVAILHPWESPQPLATTWDNWIRHPAAAALTSTSASRSESIPEQRLSSPYAFDYERTFLAQDPYHNALLALSNSLLLRMGNCIGMDLQELMELHELTVYNMNEKLWNEEYTVYSAFDMEEGKISLSGASGSWMPWIGTIPDQYRAETMRAAFEANFFPENQYLCASNSLFAASANADTPCRGAVSLWDNWLLYQGLQCYDFTDLARNVKRDITVLCSEYGFQLHYNALRDATDSNLHYIKEQAPAAAAIFSAFLKGKPLLNSLS